MSLLVNAEQMLDHLGRQRHHRSHQLLTVAAGESLSNLDQKGRESLGQRTNILRQDVAKVETRDSRTVTYGINQDSVKIVTDATLHLIQTSY